MSVNISTGTSNIKEVIAYNDWFLPSSDELDEMYNELHLYSLGDFDNAGNWYWSSSEFSSTNAYTKRFSTGEQTNNTKTAPLYVRACRQFYGELGEYDLRDVGPSGGRIFIVSGTMYFEAAPSDQSTNQEWSNVIDILVETQEGISAGQPNTLSIIGQVGHTDSAAKLCADLVA